MNGDDPDALGLLADALYALTDDDPEHGCGSRLVEVLEAETAPT